MLVVVQFYHFFYFFYIIRCINTKLSSTITPCVTTLSWRNLHSMENKQKLIKGFSEAIYAYLDDIRNFKLFADGTYFFACRFSSVFTNRQKKVIFCKVFKHIVGRKVKRSFNPKVWYSILSRCCVHEQDT